MNSSEVKISFLLIIFIFLSGCSGRSDQAAYKNAIEGGLDSFAAEDYGKAEVYFDVALNEKDNDEWAESLLKQTSAYKESINLFEAEKYAEAIEEAEMVINVSNGSEAISEKASKLITEIEEHLLEKNYSFEDFIGYYIYFSDEDSSIGDILMTIDQKEIGFNYWESGYDGYDILSTSVENNNLIVDYYYESPYEDDYEEYDNFEFEYMETNDKIMVIFDNNVYRKVPQEELEGRGWLLYR